MEFRKHTLDNGLQIVAECNDEAHSMAVAFLVKTGARDETSEVSGVSHFLEHMVFKGTPTRTADEVNQEFDQLGADYNAWTSKEHTVYHAVGLPEYQEPIVRLWADLMRPSLREEDFETEKQVIIEEIRMYEDQPPFGGDERCEAAHYGGHPLANRVLGTVESVASMRVDAMRDYFDHRYSPGNMVLAAAGQVDFESLVAIAEATCGDWRPMEVSRSVTPPPAWESSQKRPFEVLEKSSATQEYVLQLCNAPAADDPKRYAAQVLTLLLGDGSGSRLYWELLHPGLAEQVSLHYYDFDGAGLLLTWLCCEPEETAGNLRRIGDVVRSAAQDGFTDEEMARARTKIKSRLVLASERPNSRLGSVGMNWLRHREYRSVKEEMEIYAAITAADVAEVMAMYDLSRTTSVAVGPLAKLDLEK